MCKKQVLCPAYSYSLDAGFCRHGERETLHGIMFFQLFRLEGNALAKKIFL